MDARHKRLIGHFSLIPSEVETPGFSDLGLDESVLKAIADAGYSNPTPIQAGAIPVVLAGRDVIGIAQTGTGKTASFVLPMLHVLANGRARARMPRSLILSPTRELATQTASNFEIYGKYLNLTMALLIGGVGMGDQEKALEKGVDVLIATPGRLLDWFDRGKVLLGGVNIVVLDEADRMLDMGFMPDVERILSLLTGRRQTLLFSATMPPGVRRIIERFLNEPARIEVSRPATTVDAVDAVLVPVPGGELKRRALMKLIAQQGVSKAIVFANRKREVSSLNRYLQGMGLNARDIHGDLEQVHRQATLDAFKAGEVDFLVATDVAARGLDISDMPVVINFDAPYNADDYVHRIGRTGRAGKSGRAFTFATSEEGKSVAAIEKLIGKPIRRLELNGGEPEAPAAGEAAPARKRAVRRPRKEAAAAPSEAPAMAAAAPEEVLPPMPVPVAEPEPMLEAEPALLPRTGQRRRLAEPARPPAARPAPRRAPAKAEPQEAPVVAFGDNIPRFLLRPAPVAAPAKAKLA
jgi:superfamily II DNA/RNA helicase